MNIEKLETFLAPETSIQKSDSTEQGVNQSLIAITDTQNEDSNEEFNASKSTDSILPTYPLGDSIDVYVILGQLGYEEPDDVIDFIQKANSTSMDFQKFIAIAKNLHKEKNNHDYGGIIITDEVLTKIDQMIQY